MLLVKCDCNDCNNVSNKMNRVIINKIDGSNKEYDICDDCLNKIINVINNVTIADNTNVNQEVLNNSKKKIIKQAYSNSKEPKRLNVKELIERYGIDRLKEEYLMKNRSAKDIAIELGISKVTLAQYLAKLGISKRKSKNREHITENDKKEDN